MGALVLTKTRTSGGTPRSSAGYRALAPNPTAAVPRDKGCDAQLSRGGVECARSDPDYLECARPQPGAHREHRERVHRPRRRRGEEAGLARFVEWVLLLRCVFFFAISTLGRGFNLPPPFFLQQRRQFPDLTPTAIGSGYAGIASGRVLNAKHATARAHRSRSRSGTASRSPPAPPPPPGPLPSPNPARAACRNASPPSGARRLVRSSKHNNNNNSSNRRNSAAQDSA